MLATKKVTKDLCAVAYSPNEILLRKSGKQYFGKEKALARIEGTTLTVDKLLPTSLASPSSIASRKAAPRQPRSSMSLRPMTASC